MLRLPTVHPRLWLPISILYAPLHQVLIKNLVADESSAVAAEGLDNAFAGAQPVAFAVAAPASLAAPVQKASEVIQADLRFLLEDMINEVDADDFFTIDFLEFFSVLLVTIDEVVADGEARVQQGVWLRTEAHPLGTPSLRAAPGILVQTETAELLAKLEIAGLAATHVLLSRVLSPRRCKR